MLLKYKGNHTCWSKGYHNLLIFIKYLRAIIRHTSQNTKSPHEVTIKLSTMKSTDKHTQQN